VSTIASVDNLSFEGRARQSLGSSEMRIYEMVSRAMDRLNVKGNTVIDVGCGVGNLRKFVLRKFSNYIGVDVIHYEQLENEVEFHKVDLNTERIPLSDGCADAVISVETIEHLENPRAFMRELIRLLKPGGWVFVTTPNQLSLLSLLALIFKHRFSAFQDNSYPAHLTALLEIDLRRLADECALKDIEIIYSLSGRVVLTPWHYPETLSRLLPRSFSDNFMMIGRKAV